MKVLFVDGWVFILKYAKNPIAPSSCGILAITKGIFAPFIYTPISYHSGMLLTEAIYPISLFNKGSGIIIIILSLIGFWLLVKKKYVSSLVPVVISVAIIIIEVYNVSIHGVPHNITPQMKDMYSPPPYLFSYDLPSVSYELAIRGQFGMALGYLVGGYISFFFAVVMGRNQMKKVGVLSPHTFKSIVLLFAAISVIIYLVMIAGERPAVEAYFRGFN